MTNIKVKSSGPDVYTTDRTYLPPPLGVWHDESDYNEKTGRWSPSQVRGENTQTPHGQGKER